MGRKNVLFELFSTFMAFFCLKRAVFISHWESVEWGRRFFLLLRGTEEGSENQR